MYTQTIVMITSNSFKEEKERSEKKRNEMTTPVKKRLCASWKNYLTCKLARAKLLKHFLDSPHVKLLLNGGRAAARAASETASQGEQVDICRVEIML
eukprot:1149102-Pelagomonas_calceolata.AAC.2